MKDVRLNLAPDWGVGFNELGEDVTFGTRKPDPQEIAEMCAKALDSLNTQIAILQGWRIAQAQRVQSRIVVAHAVPARGNGAP